jgi:hypothetical protein
MESAHRHVWRLTVGGIPDGRQLEHRCGVSECCNPAHLRLRCNQPRRRPGKHARRNRASTLLLYKYGITVEQHDEILRKQGGKCAVCAVVLDEKIWLRRPCVDHCHQTNEVRGILCRHCNTGLGHFKDNPDSLVAAADYIKQHSSDGPAIRALDAPQTVRCTHCGNAGHNARTCGRAVHS